MSAARRPSRFAIAGFAGMLAAWIALCAASRPAPIGSAVIGSAPTESHPTGSHPIGSAAGGSAAGGSIAGGSAELGKPAPAFELKSIDGRTVKLADLKGKLVVLEWFNPACAYSKYAYDPGGPLHTYPEQLRGKGIVWLSIVSEAPENPGGKVEAIQKFVGERGIKAPMLLDPDGKVGKTYGATMTPQLYVISEKGLLVYRGALDNAPLGKVEKNEARINYVEAAIADLSSGHAVTKSEMKPYGCAVRYARP